MTVEKAANPTDFIPKSAISGAVSFKVGWAFDGACYHPGQWDQSSWSISGTGNICHEMVDIGNHD